MGFRERFRDMWKLCSLTDRFIAIFTAVLAGASIYQFIILNGQLDVMKKDTRAWMEARVTGDEPIINRQITVRVLPLNTGKTGAKDYRATMRIEVVDAGAEPTFDYSNPILNNWSEGNLVPPNQTWNLAQVDAKRQVPGTQATEPIIFTEDLRDKYVTGKLWLSAEGEMKYRDVFGIQHWLHFCVAKVAPVATRTPEGVKKCAEYNGMDDK